MLEDYEDGEVITLTDGTEDGSVGPIVQELTAEGLLIHLPGMRYTGVLLQGMTRLLTQAELPQAYS